MTTSILKNTLKITAMAVALSSGISPAIADEYQDMSDPLAVYSQAGMGATNKGLNLKLGQAYDTNNDETMAMHVLEVKGFAADLLGLKGDDSVDSLRYRHFNVNTTNGLGGQVDINWDFDNQLGSASYSVIQALPRWGRCSSIR
ncbi:hypothetical protein JCM19240_387 [Vibrio maritimus]|uniref:Uncharacterized protein n=1 Tax=Vibrio maritimus TaxID=990268 RepID=A0A090T6E4_9VIBR|nr:hypothetical protein JCM19240_387 [Vibrio maritimus]